MSVITRLATAALGISPAAVLWIGVTTAAVGLVVIGDRYGPNARKLAAIELRSKLLAAKIEVLNGRLVIERAKERASIAAIVEKAGDEMRTYCRAHPTDCDIIPAPPKAAEIEIVPVPAPTPAPPKPAKKIVASLPPKPTPCGLPEALLKTLNLIR